MLLEVLSQGSVIGAYSMLNSSPYRYTVKAKGNVQVLILEALALY